MTSRSFFIFIIYTLFTPVACLLSFQATGFFFNPKSALDLILTLFSDKTTLVANELPYTHNLIPLFFQACIFNKGI